VPSDNPARPLLEELLRNDVTHVVGVPDNMSAALFRLLENEPSIHLVTVTREGEAFALASGVWLGNGKPVVLVQNTGLLESGDSLRGTAMRMGAPLVCLVTYRGFAKLPPEDARESHELMTRADVDSVALLTEPTLAAWRVPYAHYRGPDDLSRLTQAFVQAEELSRPSALLVTRTLD
jgi:sulfopyruvate decarboxylase subunit alpha